MRRPRLQPRESLGVPDWRTLSRRAYKIRIGMIREVGAGAGYAWRCVLSVVAMIALAGTIDWLSGTTRWTSPIILFGGLGMTEYWRIATFERVRNTLLARGWTHYRFRKCWKCGYEVGGPRVEVCPECGELRYLRLGGDS